MKGRERGELRVWTGIPRRTSNLLIERIRGFFPFSEATMGIDQVNGVHLVYKHRSTVICFVWRFG